MFFDDENKKYIILDIEGNSARKVEERKMTQFSAIVIHGKEKKEINMMNRNVNYISPFVRRLTNISVKTCKVEGYSERHMVDTIYNLLKECDIVYAYGCEFDKWMINHMFEKYKYKKIDIPWVDVLDTVKEKLSPSKAKLSVAASEYGFQASHYHDALTDCYATLFLMNKVEDYIEATS